jgi:hypothetical protein
MVARNRSRKNTKERNTFAIRTLYAFDPAERMERAAMAKAERFMVDNVCK